MEQHQTFPVVCWRDHVKQTVQTHSEFTDFVITRSFCRLYFRFHILFRKIRTACHFLRIILCYTTSAYLRTNQIKGNDFREEFGSSNALIYDMCSYLNYAYEFLRSINADIVWGFGILQNHIIF